MSNGKKLKSAVMSAIGYMAVFLISAVYLLLSVVKVIPVGDQDIWSTAGDTVILLFIGMSLTAILETQGILNGMRDESYHSTVTLHGETVMRVSGHIDMLDTWCAIKNDENLKEHRIKILAGCAMKYEDYFGENGKPYVPDASRLKNKYTKKDEIRRMRAYEAAQQVKLTPLTSGVLTTDTTDREDPYKPGRSKREFQRASLLKDFIVRLCLSGLLGYYGVTLIDDFSWDRVIWKSVQLVLMLSVGIIKMQRSYLFIVDEYRQEIIKKIDNLNKFEGWLTKQLTEECEKWQNNTEQAITTSGKRSGELMMPSEPTA